MLWYPCRQIVCRDDVQLIFKNVRSNKKVYTKFKSEKSPRQIQQPVIDRKMELLAKIVNDFNLQTIFAKSSILDVSQVLTLPLITINETFFLRTTEELYHGFLEQ